MVRSSSVPVFKGSMVLNILASVPTVIWKKNQKVGILTVVYNMRLLLY